MPDEPRGRTVAPLVDAFAIRPVRDASGAIVSWERSGLSDPLVWEPWTPADEDALRSFYRWSGDIPDRVPESSTTVDEVRAEVERIRRLTARGYGDPEAHGAEDDLHQRVLRAIAAGAPDAPALAREALRTTEIDFSRWYQ